MPTGRIFLRIHPGYENEGEEKLSQFQRYVGHLLDVEVSDVSFHFLLGPYDYMIKFTCKEVDDTGLVILQLRQFMQEEVMSTLTLLEQGSIRKKVIAQEQNLRCIVLIRAHPGSEKNIENELDQMGYLESFSGVFGPYDYVIDFYADDLGDLNQKIRGIRSSLKGYIDQTMTLLPVIQDTEVRKVMLRKAVHTFIGGNTRKYFAYGPNMYIPWLKRHVSSCQYYDIAILKGYTIKFDKRSANGSGECNAVQTDDVRDIVIGVVFDIDPAEKVKLDEVEKGYHGTVVDVTTCRYGKISVYTYVADSTVRDSSLAPYAWYKNLIINGAHEHGLSDQYIQQLEAVKAKDDLDQR